ncbi:MAG: T9SS type A sorting domain-containing protein [Ignavibacteriae bacterium]|nr:T9SS type A sorting domain-containing protein [Ignavibacteriota bacterium]
MKKILQLFLILIISISLNAQQLKNVFVLSEGGFSSGTSVLSKLSLDNYLYTQYFFSLGLYPDGLVVENDNIYLVEQGNFGGVGKIYKIDSNGIIINSKEVGTNPYSLAIANEKIYITNGPTSSISVLNENDLSLVKDLSVGVYPQEIISYDGKIFVANNSLWGGNSDSTISVIDSEADEIIKTISVKLNPSSLAITNEGNLLVGCPSGVIYEIELTNFAKIDSFEIPEYGFGKDIFVDKKSDMIYFKSATNAIVGLNLNSRETEIALDDSTILNTYGYGFDYLSGNHYLTDAKNFASNGILKIYSNEGSIINSYETSIAPRRIAFQYDDKAVSVENEIINSEFKLEQNYPNPFNPSTTIKYSIPGNEKRETSKVKILIYDILGEEVATFVNQNQNHGTYEINFNASKLPSGIYYFKMQAGNFTSTKKMILMK